MKYPCKECLVQARCTDECVDYLSFINITADKYTTMTADEIAVFRADVPHEEREKIYNFVKGRFRYVIDFSSIIPVPKKKYGVPVVNVKEV